ncbi:uncharacterized protein LOC118420423 [Branchiostoma floridae]|uniref:Uncharacterized protein LOC118420423 n=1 Tax=Branchiostoma floridae TaxID=7739 RepID=A0A9J7LHM2_BRAFL|nr:uncharacterized protein LOC118420423 [Branchiostoma floridae]
MASVQDEVMSGQPTSRRGNRPKEAVFWFPIDKSTGHGPTKLVKNEGALSTKMWVTVRWGNEGDVLALILYLGAEIGECKRAENAVDTSNLPQMSDYNTGDTSWEGDIRMNGGKKKRKDQTAGSSQSTENVQPPNKKQKTAKKSKQGSQKTRTRMPNEYLLYVPALQQTKVINEGWVDTKGAAVGDTVRFTYVEKTYSGEVIAVSDDMGDIRRARTNFLLTNESVDDQENQVSL